MTETATPSPLTRMVGEGLLAAVPMTRTLGLDVVEVTPVSATLRLPDDPQWHNHVGGPHAGAMFTVGESASGAVVLAAFGSTMDRATPLAVDATIAYKKLAMGPVTATATLTRPAADVLAELDGGERPEFEVAIVLATEDGETTGEMTVRWTLKPNQRRAN